MSPNKVIHHQVFLQPVIICLFYTKKTKVCFTNHVSAETSLSCSKLRLYFSYFLNADDFFSKLNFCVLCIFLKNLVSLTIYDVPSKNWKLSKNKQTLLNKKYTYPFIKHFSGLSNQITSKNHFGIVILEMGFCVYNLIMYHNFKLNMSCVSVVLKRFYRHVENFI